MLIIRIKIGNDILIVDLENNSSAQALRDLVATKGSLVVKLHDYGGFEKVGNLGHTLPQNNQMISTRAGDLILYQGNQITINYASNTWSLTRLGRIRDKSEAELKKILGDSDLVATLVL